MGGTRHVGGGPCPCKVPRRGALESHCSDGSVWGLLHVERRQVPSRPPWFRPFWSLMGVGVSEASACEGRLVPISVGGFLLPKDEPPVHLRGVCPHAPAGT